MLKKGTSRIDGKALKNEIYKAGYRYALIERKFDLPMYLSNRVRDNWLENWLIKLLETEIGIDPKKYVIKEEPKEETTKEESAPVTSTIDYEKLEMCIKRAVAAALQDRGI